MHLFCLHHCNALRITLFTCFVKLNFYTQEVLILIVEVYTYIATAEDTYLDMYVCSCVQSLHEYECMFLALSAFLL